MLTQETASGIAAPGLHPEYQNGAPIAHSSGGISDVVVYLVRLAGAGFRPEHEWSILGKGSD